MGHSVFPLVSARPHKAVSMWFEKDVPEGFVLFLHDEHTLKNFTFKYERDLDDIVVDYRELFPGVDNRAWCIQGFLDILAVAIVLIFAIMWLCSMR